MSRAHPLAAIPTAAVLAQERTCWVTKARCPRLQGQDNGTTYISRVQGFSELSCVVESPKVAGWQLCAPSSSSTAPLGHRVSECEGLKLSSLLAYEEVHTVHLAQSAPLQPQGTCPMPTLAHTSFCSQARRAGTSSNVTSSAFLPLSAPRQILGFQP